MFEGKILSLSSACNRNVRCCSHLQEKYLKKKTDKYTVRATVERPTARSLAETLFSWRPERIQYMRADTLALLLTMANVGAHGRALVLEACGGLVTGAVAERMGGFGQVPALPLSMKPSVDCTVTSQPGCLDCWRLPSPFLNA